MVIGNDLRNEIRIDVINRLIPEWGWADFDVDWNWAATRAGNEVLKVAPNQLIIVEGMNFANNLSPIKLKTIQLDQPNKLVWSFHYYNWEPRVARFDSYEELRDDLDNNIAFVLEEGHDYTAPLWLGEFGTSSESFYWKYLIQYLSERPQIGWAYWSYDGYKYTPEDDAAYGILNNDYKTVRHPWKLAALQSVQDGITINVNQFLN